MERDRQWHVDTKPLTATKVQFGKRVFDIIASSILLLCCIPLFIVLSVSIAFASGFPVFFTQTRTGLNNKQFTIYKFRTMRCDKRKMDRHLYDWDEGVPDDFTFKSGYDSRVTSIGKVLRKYSLDELPQLFNVLIGDMSIVGPRPEIPEITAYYNLHQRKRLIVKPGMTGYAQVNGRSEIQHGKKIEHDLYYIENQSILFDMKVILSTVKLVLKGYGSY
ncbi:sugar transferase [Sporosarcina contaminans]|uniref:Sugar transferase n=1 Tax=Sporosarcina contaminans TaxID=633403 RepID=A0ABW3U0J8_9BACL